MFTKLLVANRGEIAVRIIRACKEMGILTVAVFSEADREALHVSLADESYCIGPAAAKDSYLNMEAILSVAMHSGAQAVHPGYGFLSENARFAALCRSCGLVFVGPSPEVISLMGDKDEARRAMQKAGVPVTPGSDLIQGPEQLLSEARRIGFPLLVKARAGGGGRGIRRVEDEQGLLSAYEAASAEARAAFGDGEVYLEKYLRPVKHIEVQLLCDGKGHVCCLPERECSMQRRSQKLLEESPSPAVDAALRRRLMDAARTAARACGYTGVGTVEFLLDEKKNFYFMEMNTRLQVEHPVTETVTGLDLVKWQIRIAAGVPLDFSESDISLLGHAIECRINAENPFKGFLPSSGAISLLHIPGGPSVRFDTAVYQGYVVPPYYDSMIGKLIVGAMTREEAVRKMQAALCELVIEGVEHTGEMHMELLALPEFVSGSYDTGTLDRLQGNGSPT